LRERERERERRQRNLGGREKDTKFVGGDKKLYIRFLRFPVKCPLVLQVEVMHMFGIKFLYDVGKASL
jgi:hypothetical protein